MSVQLDDIEKRAEEYAASGGRWAEGNMNGDDDPRAGYVRGCRAGYLAGARAEREAQSAEHARLRAPLNHITGKSYELTQENMQRLVLEVERLREERARYLVALEDIAGRECAEPSDDTAVMQQRARQAMG